MSKTPLNRDELLREFFPPERTEPSYGYEIELIASWPGNEDRRDVSVSLKVDELPEPPTSQYVGALITSFEELIPDEAVVVSRDVQIIRNLTDAEREI